MPEIFALEDPAFKPAMRVVTAITQGNPASVTTSFAHGYHSKEIVQIFVPKGYGMREINGRYGEITVTGDTTFTIDIDATLFNALAIPAGNKQRVQCVGIGDNNDTFIGAEQNVR